jgi:hypothetical protein
VLYRTGATGTGLFEDKPSRSRFVEQLLWEEEKRLGRVLVPGEAPVAIVRLPPCPIPGSDAAIPVTPAVAARLELYLSGTRLSATFFDTYLTCPLQFFYRYLSPLAPLAEVAEDGDRAAVGTVVHEVLREFFTPFLGRDIDGADLDPTALADLYERRMRASPAYAALPPDGQLLLLRTGRARLAEMATATPRTTPLVLETELVASLAVDGLAYPLVGRADRIDQRPEGLIILDYKTGSLPALKNTVWTDEALWQRVAGWTGPGVDDALLDVVARRLGSVQLPLYCWLHAASRGEMPADAAFVELRDRGQERPLFGPRLDPETRREAIARNTPRLLAYLVRSLKAAPRFAPRPDTRRCPYCAFKAACRA